MVKTKIVAVSGGVDSMCLLDQMRHDNIVVAHVNYGVRKQAHLETALVVKYCQKYNLKLEIYNAPKITKGNFQAEARKLRYAFFKNLCVKYSCDEVYVAHHLDDLLETYYLQVARGSTPEYYGLQRQSQVLGCNVIRPLLEFSKNDLIAYAKQYEIPYLNDDSNFKLVYQRNVVRLKVNELSPTQKQAILAEITEANQKRDRYESLRSLLAKYEIYHYSDAQFENILKFLAYGKTKFSLNSQYDLYKDLTIHKKFTPYAYQFDSIVEFECPFFKFGQSSSNGFYIETTDFPITIRNYQAGDKISQAYGHKKLSRFFKDQHIPLYERMHWPVVVNSGGEIIYVVGIGSKNKYINDKVNAFVVK